MNKIYRHRPMSPDEYLGRVDHEGKVYETRLGPDKHAGRVDLATGKVYEARLGLDKYIGRVDAENGKIYLPRLGPDEYLGRVQKDGRCYLHKRLARDEYLGKVREMSSQVHGGAGYLLLLLPMLEQIAEEKELAAQKLSDKAALKEKESEGDLDLGGETAQA